MPLTRRHDGDESRRRLSFALVVSTVLHLVALALVLRWVATMTIVPKGLAQRPALQTTLTLEQRIQPRQESQPKPAAAAPAPARPEPHPVPIPQAPPHHELARVSPTAAPQPPPAPRSALEQRLAADQSRFGNEVASLNKGDDVRISPTIAPGGAGTMKSYAFQPPGGGAGSRFGNGVITPTRHWVDGGNNCYYGHYELEYSDGASEDGDIPWPFCYAPEEDPFLKPPHPIPFPLPLPGFVLPTGTPLTPIEREVYDQWSRHG